jgi:hypothetical protein
MEWFDSSVRQLRLDAVKILLKSGLVVRAGSGAVATKLGQHQYEKMDHRKSSPDDLSFHFHKKCRNSHGWWSEVLSISKAADILRNYHPDKKVCILSLSLSLSTPTLSHMLTHTLHTVTRPCIPYTYLVPSHTHGLSSTHAHFVPFFSVSHF